MEATAIKAGNVHPHAAFADMTFEDFKNSAVIVTRILDNQLAAVDTGITNRCTEEQAVDSARFPRVGQLIREIVEVTQRNIGTNTNLGIALLICPLALSAHRTASVMYSDKASRLQAWQAELQQILRHLTAEDSADVYAAIGMAKAGGIGKVQDMDVHGSPPEDLLAAMRLAASWDDIAKEYAEGFPQVFTMAEQLSSMHQNADTQAMDWLSAIRRLQLMRLADFGDSLIARRNPSSDIQVIRELARDALYRWGQADFEISWKALDDFLRSSDHRRNPGTTADLLAAATFVELLLQR
jgi:triphosphoribosyl-dephospho-CoA synthase